MNLDELVQHSIRRVRHRADQQIVGAMADGVGGGKDQIIPVVDAIDAQKIIITLLIIDVALPVSVEGIDVGVVFRPSLHRIVTSPAAHDILAAVVGRVFIKPIMPGISIDSIVVVPTIKFVIPVATTEEIIAPLAVNKIIAALAVQGVISRPSADQIASVSSEDDIDIGVSEKVVIPRVAIDGVRASTGVDRIDVVARIRVTAVISHPPHQY